MAITQAQLRAASSGYAKTLDRLTALQTYLAAEQAGANRPSEIRGLQHHITRMQKQELSYRIRLSLSLAGVDGETFRTNAGLVNTYPKRRWEGIKYEGFYLPTDTALAEAELANLSAA